MDELQESYYFLMDRIKEKFGFDLVETFNGVKTSSMSDHSFQMPTIIPGSNMQFTSGFAVDVKPEEIMSRFSPVIAMIRSMFMGSIVFMFIWVTMRLLFTF